eukprot:jgi/Tetstr1/460712/TSEL_005899.t1
MIDFACVSSTTPTWGNDPHWCIPGMAATEAEHNTLATDRAYSASVQGFHRYYPFVVEDRGRLIGKSALTVVYIFAICYLLCATPTAVLPPGLHASFVVGANEWGKTEVARILVVVCGSSQGQAPSFRSGCGVLSDLVALSGEAYKAVVEVHVEWNPTLTALHDAMAQLHPTMLYFVCPVWDTGDGSSGGLSLGALRLGGGNVEAGGVATQEEIAECTSSGGSTCQGVNVDAKGGMRLAEVLRRRRRGVLGVET